LLETLSNIKSGSTIINCIGKIKQVINVSSAADLIATIDINALFPLELTRIAKQLNLNVIEIRTDCVFSGRDADYDELASKDPTDAYGYSKALGEFTSDNLMSLRCSIIGREISSKNSLIEWVLSNPINSEIPGYTNHTWNGVTTLHFAKICFGLISQDDFLSGVYHLIPSGQISKYELVKLIAKFFDRSDLKVNQTLAEVTVNRTLSTIFPDMNSRIWASAGYENPPTIEQMLSEFALWTNI
jgi:dTDP-4-dehydrorhamnose reductase